MKFCRVCGETLKQQEILTGTCKECEVAVSKKIIEKLIKGSPLRKMRFPYHSSVSTRL